MACVTGRINLTATVALAILCVSAGWGSSAFASAAAPAPTKLLTQDADRGSLVPTGDRSGDYRLTLHDVSREVLWFHNRPGNGQGAMTNERMLHLAFGGGERPNAAVDAWDPRRRDDVVMGLRLLSGRWDSRDRVLRYRVRELNDTGGGTRVDAMLPRRFEQAAVFVDGICAARSCLPGGDAASSSGEEISKIFVQDAARGSFEPATGDPGEFDLTLSGAKAKTLWFQDHPGTAKGVIGNQQVLDPFFREPGEEPPNAAIDAWDPEKRRDIRLGVKILDGEWDRDEGVLRYRVKPLRQVGGSAGALGQPTFPSRVTRAGVFIDDCNMGCAYLAIDLIKMGIYLNKFFTDRNTCTAIVENLSGGPLTWRTDLSNDHDSWDSNPPRTIPYTTPFETGQPTDWSRLGFWTTVAGFARGCYNNVYYAGPAGLTFDVGTLDPWTAPNEWRCNIAGPFLCRFDPGTGTVLRGDHLIVEWCIHPTSLQPFYCRFTDT